MFKRFLFLQFLLTSILFAAAPAQVIRVGNGAEPKELDPQVSTGVPESHILQNIFEALVSKEPNTLAPVPGVAEKWTVSKDGKVYTFNLRKNAVWSNGDPVTAQDFIYSWTRLLEPTTASEYAYQGHYIKNAKPYNLGQLKDAKQLGLKAIDNHTLEVTLENPTPFFIGLLYHHSLYPVHKATVEKHGKNWTKPENIVSNGPFVLKKWEINRVVTLEKNPKYWDKEAVKLQRADIFPTENLLTEEKMFRAKQLDVTAEVPPERRPVWEKDKSGVYFSKPYLGIYFYRVNVTKPPLNDKRVRKALALAIDRKQIVTYVTKGFEMPAQAFTPPDTNGYTPKAVLPTDMSRIAEAKKLLTEAGFPDGKGFPKVELLYNTQENHKKIAEAIQQMWKKNLGIEIGLLNQEWKVYLQSQQTLSYDLSRSGWIGDYNDPNTFLDLVVTNGGNNNTGWSNKEYDNHIAAAAKELNHAKRLEHFHKAEAILMEELPVIPIYVYKNYFLKDKKVANWPMNIEDIRPLKGVSIENRGVAGEE